MKNRYIVLSIALMLALLAAVIIFLPKVEVTSVQTKATYAEAVFNQSKVSKIEITLDDADLQDILDNPSEEKMVRASVTFNGKEVNDVGFRIKGNMTLRSVEQMENSDRYSFKVDFDYYDESKNLYGLKKLNLNNQYSDSTLAREYVSYQLMDTMGIPTPGNSYMYVTINGQEWGLYLGVEAIEETFLAQHFADGTGDLYKPDGVGSDLAWISDDITDYTGLNLKTNESSSDQSEMMKLLDVINNGGDLEEVMDVDEMLRYFAVNTALVNLDHYQGSMKHNYYLYEEDGIFSILPWDYNMSFGGFGGGGGGRGAQPASNPDNTEVRGNRANDEEAVVAGGNQPALGNPGGMMSGSLINENSINFSITNPVSGTTLEERPLLDALLSVDEYREQYYDYLEEIAESFFTESNMSQITNQLTALLTTYVEQDPTKFTTTEQFLEGMSGENSLVEFAVQRADSILKQLSGELVVESETESGFGDFQRPNMANGEVPNEGPPDMANGEMPNGGPPDMANGEMPDLENGNPPAMEEGGMQGIRESQPSGISSQTMIVNGICILLLIVAIYFVYRFKRRTI
ncbi:MAG: CotH kinase family protein [Bacillus sp. (in: firmicutes)]